MTDGSRFLGDYRAPAPPPPRTFRLAVGAGSRWALLVSVASIALTILLFVTTGGGFFFLFLGAAGPALAHLVSGAPRRVEVHHDRVILHHWLRPAVVLPAAALVVQQTPEEIVLVGPGGRTYGLGADGFPEGTFAECAQALAAVAHRSIVRPALRHR